MLEVLQFIFSSFWVWAGSTITIVSVIVSLRDGAFIKITLKKTAKSDRLSE